MLSLKVQFSATEVFNENDPDGIFVRKVHHTMFYVSDSDNNTIHRIHCTPDMDDFYSVELDLQKFSVPRSSEGQGFEINLILRQDGVTGEKLAEFLAEMPPPLFGEGGCQWWILKNIARMEESCIIKPGTVLMLLSDNRLDSKRLMEFEALRDLLQTKSQAKTNDITLVHTYHLQSSLQLAIAGDGYDRISDPIRFVPEPACVQRMNICQNESVEPKIMQCNLLDLFH